MLCGDYNLWLGLQHSTGNQRVEEFMIRTISGVNIWESTWIISNECIKWMLRHLLGWQESNFGLHQ